MSSLYFVERCRHRNVAFHNRGPSGLNDSSGRNDQNVGTLTDRAIAIRCIVVPRGSDANQGEQRQRSQSNVGTCSAMEVPLF